ncbi:MAG: hypothetical protein A2007_02505 [Verrucomicrobia bacterium GWC2_42_7]|nr:MAG: hypothetical protein A2007_02505 [Verrucomicrobia bacterium GWC2_42_7]
MNYITRMKLKLFFFWIWILLGMTRMLAIRWEEIPDDKKNAVIFLFQGINQLKCSLTQLQNEVLTYSLKPEALSFQSGQEWFLFHKEQIISKVKRFSLLSDNKQMDELLKNLETYLDSFQPHAAKLDNILEELKKASTSTNKSTTSSPSEVGFLGSHCSDASAKIGLVIKAVHWVSDYETVADLLLLKKQAVSEDERKKIVEMLEHSLVEQHPIPQSHPKSGSWVIRRTLAEYEKENSKHKLLLFAGHKTSVKKKYDFGFSRDISWYTVDSCWSEKHPDAVLNVLDKKDMLYFPNNWADVIRISDNRWCREHGIIILLINILKTKGTLIIPLSVNGHKDWLKATNGAQMSQTTQEREIDLQDDEKCRGKIWVSDDGREGFIKRTLEDDPAVNALFDKIATEHANAYYKRLGASSVSLTKIEDMSFFVITK